MTNEEFYDAEVAPALKALMERCQARDMPFHAVVEYAPDARGRTQYAGPNRSTGFRILEAAGRAWDNVDGLIMALMRLGRERGHGSACLSRLGVPHEPEAAPGASAGDAAGVAPQNV